MSTKNIVPRTGSQGEIGTSAKPWEKAHIDELTSSIGVSASYFYGDGSNLEGVGGTPAGSTYEIQYNDAGAFGASSELQFDSWTAGNSTLSIGSAAPTRMNNTTQISLMGGSVGSLLYFYRSGGLQSKMWSSSDKSLDISGSSDILLRAPDGVGIGIDTTDTPRAQLDVSGSTAFGSELTHTHIFTGSFHQTGSGATSYFKDTIDVEGNLTASGHISSSAAYMGSLGVGTSTPTVSSGWGVATLDGTSGAWIDLQRGGNDKAYVAAYESTGIDRLHLSSSEQILLQPGAGYFGQVQVRPNSDFDGTAGSGGTVLVYGDDTTTEYLGIGVMSQSSGIGIPTITGGGIGTNDAGLAFRTADTGVEAVRMFIDKTGSVGIGTSEPAHKLEVVGELSASTFVGDGTGITGVTGDWDGQHDGDAGITGSLEVTQLTSSQQLLKNTSLDPIADGAGNFRNYHMYVQGSSTDEKSTGIALGCSNNVGAAIIYKDKGSQGIGELQFYTKESTSGYAAPEQRMVIDLSGNVGIGVSSPTKTLDIVGDVSASLGITASAFVGTGTGLTSIAAPGSDGDVLYNNNGILDSMSGAEWDDFSGTLRIPSGGLRINDDGAIEADGGLLTISAQDEVTITAPNTGYYVELSGAHSDKGVWVRSSMTTQDITASAISADLLTMNDSTTPSTPTAGAQLYAVTGSMYVQDDSGTETKISPHDEHGEWEYFSRNTKTGKVVRIRMEKMIRKLEELTGETFIEEE